MEESKVRLVDWVWDLYAMGRLVDAADERLNGDFDEKEMECLMSVGLWCSHPDLNHRPCMIQVLGFEAPLPKLTHKMPVPMYLPVPPIPAGNSSQATVTTSNIIEGR
ncbi:hypothetical protein ACLOJK_036186 [Asimina triloba]